MLNKVKILIRKIPNLKLVVVLEFQSTKISFLKDVRKTGQKRFLSFVKLITRFRGHT